jgi:hypothetical protein
MEKMSGAARLNHLVTLLDNTAADWAGILIRRKLLFLVLFSAAYFGATCYRASRKLFWFDEIFTVYLSNLPDLRSLWQALTHGVDFNPPLLYIFTRFSEGLLGHGHLGARFPEICGFWIFCVCLFRFVSFRTDALGGFIAMMVPLITTAYWYAYEARSYGIVLGFCGLALVCWQAAGERTTRRWWLLAGLGAALFCALSTHSYAVLLFVPFVIGELTRTLVRKRADWKLWLAILLPGSAVLLSLPLLHQAQSILTGQFSASVTGIFRAYQFLFAPAANVWAAILVFFCIGETPGTERYAPPREAGAPIGRAAQGPHALRTYELAASLAFLAMPFFCFFAARVTHSPVLHRYSLSVVIGLACLLGAACRKRVLVSLAVLLVLSAQITLELWGFRVSDSITEPITSTSLSTSLKSHEEEYKLIGLDSHKELPVVLLDDLAFAPSFYYAPPEIASRLTYLSIGDGNGDGYSRLIRCCGARGSVSSLPGLLAKSRTFLAYTSFRSNYVAKHFVDDGASVVIEKISGDHALYLVTYGFGVRPTGITK